MRLRIPKGDVEDYRRRHHEFKVKFDAFEGWELRVLSSQFKGKENRGLWRTRVVLRSWNYDALVAKAKALLPSYRQLYIASNDCDFVIPTKAFDLFERWDFPGRTRKGDDFEGRINRDALDAYDKSTSTFTGRRFITTVRGAHGIAAWLNRLIQERSTGWDGELSKDCPTDPDDPALRHRPPTPEEKAVLEKARSEINLSIVAARKNKTQNERLPRDEARLVIRNEVVKHLKAERVDGVGWNQVERRDRPKDSTLEFILGDDRDRVEVHATEKGDIVVKTILEGSTPIASAYPHKSPENATSKAREAARRVTAAVAGRPENLPANPTERQLAALLDYALERLDGQADGAALSRIKFVREFLSKGDRDRELKAGRTFMNRVLAEAKIYNDKAQG